MSYYRIRFPISVSGGTAKGDTGRLLGEVQQFRWYPTTADTGQPATLNLAVLPDTSDSGVGFNVYTQAAVNLGAAFTRWPRMQLHDPDGTLTDTGIPGVPAVGANDRLRVKVVPADTGVVIAGNLYVWVKD